MSRSSTNPLPPLISPAILQRVMDGTFVADRRDRRHKNRQQPTKASKGNDRRTLDSPLAITKRCVPYTPGVFHHRKQDLLRLATALNQPTTRGLTVTGPSGSGKTALVRGLVEMMGSGPEQVLWVDGRFVHTEADMATVLIDALRHLANRTTKPDPPPPNLNPIASVSAQPDSDDPMLALQHQLAQLAHMPILVVIDHTEALLAPGTKHFASPITQELLAFLHTLPNITLAIIGQLLPTTIQQFTGLVHHTCSTLTDTEAVPLYSSIQHIKVHGLPATEAQLLAGLLAIRHPVSLAHWRQLSDGLTPPLPGNSTATIPLPQRPVAASDGEFFTAVKASSFKGCLKRRMPPQRMLAHWQGEALSTTETSTTWHYNVYEAAQETLKRHIDTSLMIRAHRWLSQWYLAQRKAPMATRWLPVANSQLVQEARYHLERAERMEAQQRKQPRPLIEAPPHDETIDANTLIEGLDTPLTAPPLTADDEPYLIPSGTLNNLPDNDIEVSQPLWEEVDSRASSNTISKSLRLEPLTDSDSDLTDLPTQVGHPPEDVDHAVTIGLAQAKQLANQKDSDGAKHLLTDLLAQLTTTETHALWWQGVIHHRLAKLHLADWDINLASTHIDRSHQSFTRLSPQSTTSQQTTALPRYQVDLAVMAANIAHARHQPNVAYTACNSVQHLLSNIDSPALVGKWHVAFATALDDLGQAHQAMDAYQAAIDTNITARRWQAAIAAACNLGCLYLETDTPHNAIAPFAQAQQLEIAHQGGASVETLRLLAQAHAGCNKPTLAGELLNQALGMANTAKRPDWQVGILAELADVYPRQARHYLSQALQRLTNLSDDDQRWAQEWQHLLQQRLNHLPR